MLRRSIEDYQSRHQQENVKVTLPGGNAVLGKDGVEKKVINRLCIVYLSYVIISCVFNFW